MNFQAVGSKPSGRPHKTWKKTLEEGIEASGLTQVDDDDRKAQRTEMKWPTLQRGKNGPFTMMMR